jgi:hypothetical protein
LLDTPGGGGGGRLVEKQVLADLAATLQVQNSRKMRDSTRRDGTARNLVMAYAV